MANNDVVAVWDVPMNDGLYTVEFEHGTLTGKRIIRINGTVIFIINLITLLIYANNEVKMYHY